MGKPFPIRKKETKEAILSVINDLDTGIIKMLNQLKMDGKLTNG